MRGALTMRGPSNSSSRMCPITTCREAPIQTVRVEGTNIPVLAESALPNAEKAVEALKL